MRRAHDVRRQPLLLAVELPHLQRRALAGMRHVHPGERDHPAEHGRAHRRCHLPDLRAALADAVARRGHRAGLERVGRVVELATREDEPRLDAHHVERGEAEGDRPVRLARLP